LTGDATAPAAEGWVRHPADLARLVAALLGLAVVLGLTLANPDLIRTLSRDLARLANRLPDPVEQVAAGVCQLAAVLGPLALLVGLVVHRLPRLAAALALAAASAAGLAAVLQHWLDEGAPPETFPRLDATSWVTGAAFPSPAYLAGLAAVITVLVPNLPRAWRRVAWWTLAAAALIRILSAVALPLQLAATILLGVAVGSLVLVLLGAPARHARRRDVVAVLDRAGLAVDAVERTPDGSGFVVTATGEPDVEVEVVDRDARDADLFFRAVTALRVRGFDDDRPGWSPERVVQHQALATLLARSASTHVPDVLVVAETEDGAGVLATRSAPGPTLDEVDVAALTDDVLTAAWAEVTALHRARIAHRRLHLGNLRLTGDGTVLLTGLRAARLNADDTVLAVDVAELLASLALRVGASRAVASAVPLGPTVLEAALPLLQPLALSAPTRRRLKQAKGDGPDLLEELRDEVQHVAGVHAYELAAIQRITVGRVVGVVGAVVLFYAALAFASNWDAIATALEEADWSYAPVVLLMAALGFPAGAMSLMGAVTNRLPLLETTQVMLGQSFLNRFTPANAGGMALRARYLQKQGVELSVAAASVGITSMASGALQVVLLIVFLAWAGDSETSRFELPDTSTVALVLLVILVLGAVVWVTPLGARLRSGRLAVSTRQVLAEIRALAAQPSKLALLFGGALLGKLTTLVAFAASAYAFDIDLGFAQLSALYMTANTVASAAPTPGGVGAIEAALIAVLTGAGADPAVAVSAVFLFRFATYWLPVPPAWLALQGLRKQELV
jgi:undecaprenyl-diphosphatase